MLHLLLQSTIQKLLNKHDTAINKYLTEHGIESLLIRSNKNAAGIDIFTLEYNTGVIKEQEQQKFLSDICGDTVPYHEQKILFEYLINFKTTIYIDKEKKKCVISRK